MDSAGGFAAIETTVLADVLGREQVMDTGLRALWPAGRRVAGPAFTVVCAPGDNLMLHAAIYRAPPGSVLACEAGTTEYAVAGGNVCAVAARRGIAGLVVDGAVRDIAEVREAGFAVWGRAVTPLAGRKAAVAPLGQPVRCGGVRVGAGDIIVADDDGVVVVPAARREQVLAQASAKSQAEARQSLDDWQAEHHARIEALLAAGAPGGGQDRT